MAGIDEKLLAKLGEEGLGNHHDVPKLGRELGFKEAKISLYMQTNHVGGQVGSKGTVNLLFDWKRNTARAKQVPTLRAALVVAGFQELAEEYFPDHSGTCSSTPSPLPDLLEPIASITPNQAPSSVSGQETNPGVDPAYDQDIENPSGQSSGSPSMGTVNGRQIVFLSENIIPGRYQSFCTHLGFEFSIYDGIKKKHLNDTEDALVEILNRWRANTGGATSELDDALIAAQCRRLVDQYKDVPQ